MYSLDLFLLTLPKETFPPLRVFTAGDIPLLLEDTFRKNIKQKSNADVLNPLSSLPASLKDFCIKNIISVEAGTRGADSQRQSPTSNTDLIFRPVQRSALFRSVVVGFSLWVVLHSVPREVFFALLPI